MIAGCSFIGTPESATAPVQTAEYLPSSVSPRYCEYTVKLDIQPSERIVTGVERIKIINTTNQLLDKIYINAPLNAFSEDAEAQPVFNEFMEKVYPEGVNYGYIKFSNVSVDGDKADFNLEDTVLIVDLADAVPPNEWTELKMELEAKIPIMNHRTGSDEDSMWFGNFLPALAVYDDDGWHTDSYYPVGDPFFREAANFSVSITAPQEYTVAGPGIPATYEKDGKKTTEFTAKLARGFAFTLSRRYTSESLISPSNIEINLYTFSNTARKAELLDLASRSLEYFSDRIGSYPYSQLTIAETRLFNKGGMEYPGVIFIDSNFLAESDNLESVTHEIGHQWFYNIIGNNQIDDAWMDEGLDSFVQEGFLLNDAELDEKMQMEYADLKAVISQIKPNTLDSGLGEFKNWLDYYNIHYLRGKLMFYSLYKKIGKTDFDSFLVEYNRRFTFRMAYPNDLIQTAEDVSGSDLSAFFNDWINNPELPPLI
ncbi:MAG: M1 family metallopeptidase [Clostridiales bacterium]|nr:M1 family metallopeptidase [Clostridiales bacterium]